MPSLRTGTFSVAVIVLAALIWVSHLAISHLHTRDTWLDGLEYRLLDLRYRIVGPVAAAPDVVFVAIDDETLERERTTTTGRLLLARVIEKIAQSGAQSLVLDVLLADAGEPEERAALAHALGTLPTVIAAAARFDEGGDVNVIWPHDAFLARADVGLVNLQTDASGTPRFVPLFLEVQRKAMPSMPLVGAMNRIGGRASIGEQSITLGSLEIALDKGAYMPLRLLGPSGTVTTLSAGALMEEATSDALSGKLVVLGYSATGTGDLFTTPFEDEVAGAEIIATAILQLVGGSALTHDDRTRTWDVLHMVLLASVALILMLRAPIIAAVPMLVCVLLLSLGGVTVAFAHSLWLSAALPLAGALPPVLLAGAHSLARERRNARVSEQSLISLRRFQSPSLARRIEEDPDFLTTPEQQDLVVFFVDLTGFTALSQKLGSEGTRALLQQFHELTGMIVQQNDGTVINFMGDGALAVFGLEQGQNDRSSADQAFRSAEELEVGLATLPIPPDCPAVTCRIGLHYGSVILSRLGAQNHQQVTVSGDTVNLASRLMEVAKSRSARIVATSEFANQLDASLVTGVATPARVEVRGWSGDVAVVLWPRTRTSESGDLS